MLKNTHDTMRFHTEHADIGKVAGDGFGRRAVASLSSEGICHALTAFFALTGSLTPLKLVSLL